MSEGLITYVCLLVHLEFVFNKLSKYTYFSNWHLSWVRSQMSNGLYDNQRYNVTKPPTLRPFCLKSINDCIYCFFRF